MSANSERVVDLKAHGGLSRTQEGLLSGAGPEKRYISVEERIIHEAGTRMQKEIIELRGEEAVTSALVNVVEGKVRRFYFIGGKGSRSDTAVADAFDALTEIGRQQNFELLPVNLSDVNTITDHADGIILIGARYDLTERELRMLDEYWNAPRAGILMLLDPNRITKNLNQWLAANGVRPRGDRVLMARSTSAGPKKEFGVQSRFSRDVSFVKHLGNSIT